jgi:hypothetical protein
MALHQQAVVAYAFFIENVEQDEDNIPTSASIKETLSHCPENPPIYFDCVTERDFLTWIVSLR